MRLEQLLREANQRAQEAEERTRLERRLAEDEQRNRQEAESRAQIKGRETKSTTFEEYIRACHTLLSKPLRILTDKSSAVENSTKSAVKMMKK